MISRNALLPGNLTSKLPHTGTASCFMMRIWLPSITRSLWPNEASCPERRESVEGRHRIGDEQLLVYQGLQCFPGRLELGIVSLRPTGSRLQKNDRTKNGPSVVDQLRPSLNAGRGSQSTVRRARQKVRDDAPDGAPESAVDSAVDSAPEGAPDVSVDARVGRDGTAN